MEHLKQKFLSHFSAEEIKSITQTFIAFLSMIIVVADTLPQVQNLLNGDWSLAILFAAFAAIGRSAIKIAWSLTVLWATKKEKELPAANNAP